MSKAKYLKFEKSDNFGRAQISQKRMFPKTFLSHNLTLINFFNLNKHFKITNSSFSFGIYGVEDWQRISGLPKVILYIAKDNFPSHLVILSWPWLNPNAFSKRFLTLRIVLCKTAMFCKTEAFKHLFLPQGKKNKPVNKENSYAKRRLAGIN